MVRAAIVEVLSAKICREVKAAICDVLRAANCADLRVAICLLERAERSDISNAASWAEWKQTLLQTSHKIATLTDLQKQHANAENYVAANETKAERETMETALAEDMTQVRASLDERRSQS